MTTSCCWNCAVETPFIATRTGSPTPLPGSGAKTGTPARSPTICSWFTALGRWRSAAISSGVWPSDFIHCASLPARVVLPAPWRPASMMTVGGFFDQFRSRASPPSTCTSSSLTILTTCWAGLSALETSSPRARSRTAAVKVRTTDTATSASSRARRISRIVLSTSASLRRPWPRRPLSDSVMRSERLLNTKRFPLVGRTAPV